MLKPVAFMVMPFGKKAVDATGTSSPTEVDFDALWDRVYDPVLTGLGYEAVRADQDLGALVITEMIQRLTIADLVLADVTLPNANVYYELGIRHAAKRHGCVMVAAEWANPAFDLAQLRRVRFPLSDGTIPEAAAPQTIKELTASIAPLIHGASPVFESVPGYPDPDKIDPSTLSSFRTAVAELSAFDSEVRAVSLLPAQSRAETAQEIVKKYGYRPTRDVIALRLLRLLADTAARDADWEFLVSYIDDLPAELGRHPLVVEQRALALGKKGDSLSGAAGLEALIATEGGTAERYGLLGGRYKELMKLAATQAERRRYLNRAIACYEDGMRLDLNNFYPISNLPRLYRQRNDGNDLLRAAEVAVITTEACRRAIALGIDDKWTKATLLGMAFYRGDVIEAQELKNRVADEGPGVWQLESTLGDLRADVRQQDDPDIRAALSDVLSDLEKLAQ